MCFFLTPSQAVHWLLFGRSKKSSAPQKLWVSLSDWIGNSSICFRGAGKRSDWLKPEITHVGHADFLSNSKKNQFPSAPLLLIRTPCWCRNHVPGLYSIRSTCCWPKNCCCLFPSQKNMFWFVCSLTCCHGQKKPPQMPCLLWFPSCGPPMICQLPTSK